MFSPRFSILLATLLGATQLTQATYVDLPHSGPLHQRAYTSGLIYDNSSYYINITFGEIHIQPLIDMEGGLQIRSSVDGVKHIQLLSAYNFQC